MRTTTDAVLDGALIVEQPAHGSGYRFNVDSVHLARFVAPRVRPGTDVADLGAGVGVVALCVGALALPGHLTLVERDEPACELARRNLLRAGWSGRSEVVTAELADWNPARSRPVVIVANPPYTPPGHGRPARVAAVAGSRQGDVTVFVDAAARLLASVQGIFALCYPAHALTAVLAHACDAGLTVVRTGFVHASRGAPARLALVELARGPWSAGVVVPPLFEA